MAVVGAAEAQRPADGAVIDTVSVRAELAVPLFLFVVLALETRGAQTPARLVRCL